MNDYVTGLAASGLDGIPGMGCACNSGMNDYVGVDGFRDGSADFSASGMGDAAQLDQQAAMAEAGGDMNLANALRTQARIERAQGASASGGGGSSGAGTSVGEDIVGGIKSFFGGVNAVSTGVMKDPTLGPLAQFGLMTGLSKLVPGMKQNAPAPQPPPPRPWTTTEKALAALAGVGVIGGGVYLLTSKKK